MAVLPGIYAAKATKREGAALIAFVPQIFGEQPITIRDFVGAAPTKSEMGWVSFQGGNPEYPVWFGTSTVGSGFVDLYVNTAGDEMTGALTLPGDPIEPQHAATKEYVDAAMSSAVQFPYVWSNNTTTTVDPGVGTVRANNGSPLLATQLALSTTDNLGAAHPTVAQIAIDDEIALYVAGNLNRWGKYKVTNAVNTSNVWVRLDVTLVSQGTEGFAPANNSDVQVILRTGGAARSTIPDNMLYDVVPLSNRWVTPGGTEVTTGLSQGWAQFIPVRVPPCNINGIGVDVTTASTATGLRLGIYHTHATQVQPYSLLVTGGVTASAAAGWRSVTFSPVAWPGGLMWLVVVALGGGCNLRGTTGFGEPWIMFDVGQTPPNLTYRAWTSPIGEVSLPNPLPSTLGVAGGGNPKISFKTS